MLERIERQPSRPFRRVVSKGEGRRLMKQGGIKLRGTAVDDFNRLITLDDFDGDTLLLQKGKKTFKRIRID